MNLKETLLNFLETIEFKYVHTKVKGELKTLVKKETEFLDKYKNVTLKERIYCIINDITDRPICRICGIKHCRFMFPKYNDICNTPKCVTAKAMENVKKKYGVDHISQLEDVKQKKTETALKNYGSLKKAYYDTAVETWKEKYGVDNVSKSDEIKHKKSETCLKNFGVEHPMQSKEIQQKNIETINQKYSSNNISQVQKIKEKKKETFQEHYGVDNCFQSEEIKQIIKATVLKLYGVDNVSKSEIIKQKKIETCLKNFGVEHPTQNMEIMKKAIISMLSTKRYQFPSGRIDYLQGYEPQVIDWLLTIMDESNIETHDLVFDYVGIDQKKHKYFPDIHLKKENIIIEVKSFWTFFNEINLLEKAKSIQSPYKILYIIPHQNEIYQCDFINNKFIFLYTIEETKNKILNLINQYIYLLNRNDIILKIEKGNIL